MRTSTESIVVFSLALYLDLIFLSNSILLSESLNVSNKILLLFIIDILESKLALIVSFDSQFNV